MTDYTFSSAVCLSVRFDSCTAPAIASCLTTVFATSFSWMVLSTGRVRRRRLPAGGGRDQGVPRSDVGRWPRSGAGLAHLRRLTLLEYVDLSHTHVTDTGLSHLRGLTGLQYLWLDDTQVTSA